MKMVAFSPLPAGIIVRAWGMVVGSRKGSWCAEGTCSPVYWSEFSTAEWTRVWRCASPHRVPGMVSFFILWVEMGVVDQIPGALGSG